MDSSFSPWSDQHRHPPHHAPGGQGLSRDFLHFNETNIQTVVVEPLR